MENATHFEIERKYLIEYPDTDALSRLADAGIVGIVQTYLKSGPDGENRRVRSWTESGNQKYIYTEKKKISALTQQETEYEISETEYKNLLTEKKKKKCPIEKTRYRVRTGDHIAEIDVFPFWEKAALLEIEMKSEDDEFVIPAFIRVIKEVTFDRRYKNAALAGCSDEERKMLQFAAENDEPVNG